MILAIDPSLSATAIIRGDANGYESVVIGSEPKGDSAGKRIARYSGLIGRIMDWIGPAKPDAIFIEGYSFDSVGSGRFLAEFGGLFRKELLALTDQLWEIPPTMLKKFATGKGNAKKKNVCARLRTLYKVEFKTADEFDAFALFQMALMYHGHVEPRDGPQAEVLHVLKNPPVRKTKASVKRAAKARERNLF
jgi:crossover junction endodeoxyribonuclease RuvC